MSNPNPFNQSGWFGDIIKHGSSAVAETVASPWVLGGPVGVAAGAAVNLGEKAADQLTPKLDDSPLAATAAPTPPTAKSAAPEQAVAAAEEKKPRSRASTILTSGRGLLGSPTTARRTLLGG